MLIHELAKVHITLIRLYAYEYFSDVTQVFSDIYYATSGELIHLYIVW
jgi:hypothetical protein